MNYDNMVTSLYGTCGPFQLSPQRVQYQLEQMTKRCHLLSRDCAERSGVEAKGGKSSHLFKWSVSLPPLYCASSSAFSTVDELGAMVTNSNGLVTHLVGPDPQSGKHCSSYYTRLVHAHNPLLRDVR